MASRHSASASGRAALRTVREVDEGAETPAAAAANPRLLVGRDSPREPARHRSRHGLALVYSHDSYARNIKVTCTSNNRCPPRHSSRGCIGPQDEDEAGRIGHLREQGYLRARGETIRDALKTRVGAQHTDDGDDIQNAEP